jgi:SAM-dependent methyltransferase
VSWNDPAVVAQQYASEVNLEARRALYENVEGPDPRELTFAAVAEVRPRRVLEVGCGQGWLSERIQRDLGCEVVAVDQSEHMVDLTRARGVRAEVADAEELPFEDAQFDLVYSVSIFTHLDEQSQDAWLAEIDRVLEPGGIGLLTTAGQPLLDSFRGGLQSNSRDFSERIAAHRSVEEEGFIFEPYARSRWNAPDFPGIGESYGLTLHSEQYVRDHWSRFFDVEAYWPAALNVSQNLVLVRKRGGEEG